MEEKDQSMEKDVFNFTNYYIRKLSANSGDMAIWRHAFAKGVCEDIKAWSLLQKDIPSELTRYSKPEIPSYAENAVYMALSAYAACGAHAEGISFGHSAKALGDNARGRFSRLEMSNSIDKMWRNLKDIMRLISSQKGVGIDYGLLAKDLYDWQFDHIPTVRKWESEYYRSDLKKKSGAN